MRPREDPVVYGSPVDPGLTEHQLKSYQKKGFLLLNSFFSPHEVRALMAEAQSVAADPRVALPIIPRSRRLPMSRRYIPRNQGAGQVLAFTRRHAYRTTTRKRIAAPIQSAAAVPMARVVRR